MLYIGQNQEIKPKFWFWVDPPRKNLKYKYILPLYITPLTLNENQKFRLALFEQGQTVHKTATARQTATKIHRHQRQRITQTGTDRLTET